MIEPLTIEWGSFETATTVTGLARCLLDHWPGEGQSEAYVTALMVCDAVLTGSDEDNADDARAAFVEAAHEAGLTILPDDDLML
ncbi:DUF982 domain-containing protein [Agrobacterium cavarae]|uniref:DUF982 domain-containing protein n=1 Tax=Agrobacterium cavarae TaxID=2528239 RepID=UPI002FF84BEE